MKQYPSEHAGPDTGPGRCFQLLEKSRPEGEIVLDIGCGRAPVAEQVRELGMEYVGVDADAEALAEVGGRGFETHRLDLGGPEDALSAAIAEIVGSRKLAAVLIVDVLEHLVHPERVLMAVRNLGSEDERFSLVVSVPNVTHLDIASKLLIGRWDPTEFGLLDDTHLRFFSERLFTDLFRLSGWREVEAADVVNPVSDQRFPADAPVLRTGAPAHEVLRDIGERSHRHWATYQFVRRFIPAERSGDESHRWPGRREADDDRPYASVLVRASDPPGAQLQRLLGDLEAQTSNDFETIALVPPGASIREPVHHEVRAIETPPGPEGWNRGIESARGRYLCLVDDSVRLSSRWLEAFRSQRQAAGSVLRVDGATVRERHIDGAADADGIVASGTEFMVNPLDLLYRPGPIVLAAYAVPLEATRTAGIRFEGEHGTAAPAVFLTRAAALCGISSVPEATVAVSAAAIDDGEQDVAAVATALDQAPLILPPGSASRIVTLRRFRSRFANPVRWLQRRAPGFGTRSSVRKPGRHGDPGTSEPSK